MTEKKKLKIEFAESTVVDALEPYLNEVLEAIGEIFSVPNATGSFVSDLSRVTDFLEWKPTGETKPHPRREGKTITVVTFDIPENDEKVRLLSERLGFAIERNDYLYDVVLNLRKKHEDQCR